MVHVGLGHSRRHRAHADLGDQLHRDAGLRVHVLEVVDELGQILDGVDVVVGRRGDQTHPRDGMAHPGDLQAHFVTGELTPLAGLGPLDDLDLDVVRVDQILGGHAETARGHLLDGGAFRVAGAVRQGGVAFRLLASLAGIGLAAQGVHGPRQV